MDLDFGELRLGFKQADYFLNEDELRTVYLALRLDKPLLVGGPSGVGKTYLAKVLAVILQAGLLRLQCHKGLDESNSLYDWNIQRQLVKIHMSAHSSRVAEEELFSLANVLQRPLLQAVTADRPVVLLIDEVDRSDPSFEAFLLEVLSDFQVSIPEIGTITARRKPVVVVTNNGERELSEALKRRCVFLYLDFPNIEEEAYIIRKQTPKTLDELNENMALAVAGARDNSFQLGLKSSSRLDWARALLLLNADHYQPDYIEKTLASLAKNKESLDAMQYYLHQQREAGSS
jgi:MoxR-like ATPase